MAPLSIPDWSIPSNPSSVLNVDWAVIFVLPPGSSSKVSVSVEIWVAAKPLPRHPPPIIADKADFRKALPISLARVIRIG